jgi:hypothetical protein
MRGSKVSTFKVVYVCQFLIRGLTNNYALVWPLVSDCMLDRMWLHSLVLNICWYLLFHLRILFAQCFVYLEKLGEKKFWDHICFHYLRSTMRLMAEEILLILRLNRRIHICTLFLLDIALYTGFVQVYVQRHNHSRTLAIMEWLERSLWPMEEITSTRAPLSPAADAGRSQFCEVC